MKRIVLDVEEYLHQKIKEKALKEKKTMRKVLIELLKKWLKK